LQPREVIAVPFSEIELALTLRPRREILARRGRERVTRDVEVARCLAVGPGKDTREIQPVRAQCLQVTRIVELAIQDRAVVLSGRDQNRWLPIEERVTRIIRVQLQGLRVRHQKCRQHGHKQSHWRSVYHRAPPQSPKRRSLYWVADLTMKP